MTTITIEVATREETNARLLRAFSGEPQGSFISFPTVEALLKTLTAKRLHVIRTMLGAGSLTIREVARRVNRDVKAVHGDIQSLLAASFTPAKRKAARGNTINSIIQLVKFISNTSMCGKYK